MASSGALLGSKDHSCGPRCPFCKCTMFIETEDGFELAAMRGYLISATRRSLPVEEARERRSLDAHAVVRAIKRRK